MFFTLVMVGLIKHNRAMKMQRVIHKQSLHAQEAHAMRDLQYWLSQPVQARLAAVEVLRNQMAGQDAERRLQRVCRITSLKQG
ncbi:MAG: hypothetical protein KF796_02070 [Ramlibacter sp.]|nr:hypothetical protein [Ramlibacter sp.]